MATFISNMFMHMSKTHHQETTFPSTSTKFPSPPSISLPTKSLQTAKYINALASSEEEPHPRRPEAHEEKPLADRWQEIHGLNNWAGLLDPMDSLLRSELIRYGEMAQACYDAFDFEPSSKYYGSCKYAPYEFFECLDMGDLGYTVTRYLYATITDTNPLRYFKNSRWPKMWSKHASWMGYVAVSDDSTSTRLGRRDITVVWRGTANKLEWISSSDFLVPISSKNIGSPDEAVQVDSGFLQLYTDKNDACLFSKYSARERVLTEVKRLVEMYSDEELSISVTGHGIGSALAILSAFDIAEMRLNLRRDCRRVGVTVFSFSGPRVGNERFKKWLERVLGVKVLSVVNVHDVVPKARSYSQPQVGVELALDHRNSPFLKPDAGPLCAHNLEAHLHLIDGFQVIGGRFLLANGRDPALVNKASDFLRDHFMVPPYWMQDENKGMIKYSDGCWVQAIRPKLDGHPQDIHYHLEQLGLI